MSLRERISGVRETLSRSWVLLVISLVLAALIWLMSNLSRQYSGTVSVPVIGICNIDGHRRESVNTAVVSARCRTQGYRLVREQSRRERRPVKVVFDKGDLHRIGPDVFCIVGGAKNSYAGAFFGEETSVEAFITDTLRFIFPAENHKKVPVHVPQSIVCRSQYMQSGPLKVQPDSVTVYGEDARLEAVEKVDAVRLSLGDVHEPAHGMLRLQIPEGVRCSHDQVSYELPVTRYVELRSQVSVEVWNAPAGHKIQVFPPVADVVLLCAFPVSRDPLSSFKLYIDYRDFASSLTGRCVPRTLRLPAGVLQYRVSPEVFDCIESL